MVIAISRRLQFPVRSRVLVPALCTTHVDGAIVIGMFSAKLLMSVDMDVNVSSMSCWPWQAKFTWNLLVTSFRLWLNS